MGKNYICQVLRVGRPAPDTLDETLPRPLIGLHAFLYLWRITLNDNVMKKIVLLTILVAICCVTTRAQVYDGPSDSDLRTYSISQDTKVPFRLFPTRNMWNFMKLDTRTGQIWMVQFSVKSSEGTFTWILDDTAIEQPTAENVGRFTLYPTGNRFNYILLDQFDGRTWQVQYSLDETENNMRTRIY